MIVADYLIVIVSSMQFTSSKMAHFKTKKTLGMHSVTLLALKLEGKRGVYCQSFQILYPVS